MIERVQKPYEFLVRWTDGTVSGAHIGFVEQLIDNGKVLSQTPLPVQPVSLAGGAGFPLETVLSQLHISALAAVEETQTELVAAKARIAELEKQNGEHAQAAD